MTHVIRSGLPGICLALILLNACSPPQIELVEASGLVRVGDELIIVSDDSAGVIFRYTLPDGDYRNGSGPLLANIPIDSAVHYPFTHASASDLEGIDVLPDGQIVVLSEQAPALFTRNGLAAQYPDALKEVAGRGLEGLSIHTDGQIVVLWEGGYYHPASLENILADPAEKKLPQKPRFCVHTVPVTKGTSVCQGENAIKVLKVPSPPDSTQAFRTPDLVWSKDGKSFIVLLASLNAANDSFRYLWLQEFSLSGNPVGAPLNLCDSGYLPKHLRHGPESNIEGLAWFDAGESLILINDTNRMATAAMISVNPWPKTDNTIACDY